MPSLPREIRRNFEMIRHLYFRSIELDNRLLFTTVETSRYPTMSPSTKRRLEERKKEDVWNQSVSCVAVRRKWVLLKYEPTSCRWATRNTTCPVDRERSIVISQREEASFDERLEETHRHGVM